MGMFKKATAKTTVMTPIQINGITVTNVEQAVSQINEQLSNISTGGEGGTTVTVTGKPYDIGNFNMVYTFYEDGKIQKETITGDINRVTEYTYLSNGRVLTEKITESGKSITRTFSYNSEGKISSISVMTATI